MNELVSFHATERYGQRVLGLTKEQTRDFSYKQYERIATTIMKDFIESAPLAVNLDACDVKSPDGDYIMVKKDGLIVTIKTKDAEEFKRVNGGKMRGGSKVKKLRKGISRDEVVKNRKSQPKRVEK